jgi:hypothetical protein
MLSAVLAAEVGVVARLRLSLSLSQHPSLKRLAFVAAAAAVDKTTV